MARGRLPVRQALLLGAVHGPAELLPVSSSGHTAVLPWLLGWRYPELEAELRKSFEVALHAGSAAGWTLSGATGSREALGSGRWLAFVLLATAPAGVAGLVLERRIQERLGTPASVATGLILGAAAMAVADRTPGRREAEEAGAADAIWMGLAQVMALLPGVSRGGATLVAARLRRFSPSAAWRLSAMSATPVIAGATGLKLARMVRRRPSTALVRTMAVGGGASFACTLVSARLMRPADRGWPLTPFAAYRLALGLMISARLRRSGPRSRARRFRSAGA